ncbi:recombinase family protein [Paenibacillus odorifer]|uniref:recombinase family protein n=1 Tax=Paenibacillus TaxID=44249 RepID=UPI00096E011D|nr:recombinase family protein [Paenibacillus odorifer]OMC98852.1 hypothetical protein BJP46_03780 [Paenibacillus odorifer]
MKNQQQISLNQGRVVLYVRTNQIGNVSNEKGIKEQLDKLHTFCIDEGKTVVATYVDKGFSGKNTDNRPSLIRLLEEAKESGFDEVLTMDLTRISRDMNGLLMVMDLLENRNVALKTLNDRFDSKTALGKCMIQMLAVFQRFELDSTFEAKELERASSC